MIPYGPPQRLPRKLRPAQQPERAEVVHVDYADVLRQAVANERFRVIAEIRDRVRKIQVDEYSSRGRTGPQVKADVNRIIDDVEEVLGNA